MSLLPPTAFCFHIENFALCWLLFTRLAEPMTSNTTESGIMMLSEITKYLKVTERTIYQLS